MNKFDKEKIKFNFNKHSKNYQNNAILQKIVSDNLVELAKKKISKATTIIDLGCGDGFISDQVFNKKIIVPNHLQKIFQLDFAIQMLEQNRWINKINGDIEMLPLRDNCFDLAISSLSFQWLNNFENSIFKILNVIKKGGSFYFSLIVDGSLKELKTTNSNFNSSLWINNFIKQEELEIILKKTNLRYCVNIDELNLTHKNIYSLLKSIKSIGAGYSENKKYLSKRMLEEMSNFYLNNFNLNNKLVATWRVFYVSIQK